MQPTDIDYLDDSWNPLAMLCTPVGPGCANCWHLAMARRLAANAAFSPEVRAAYAGDGPPVLRRDKLDAPLRRRKPARIGVQFMGDLWHEAVDPCDRAAVIRATNLAPQHTYLFLSKRPARFDMDWSGSSNLWPGVSVEDQQRADDRIRYLLKTQAAVRWLSLEPLLEQVDVTDWLSPLGDETCNLGEAHRRGQCGCRTAHLDWVVVGAESGPHCRPCKLDWMKDIVEQCRGADVPVFVKQLDLDDRVSHDPAEWPAWARVRDFPRRPWQRRSPKRPPRRQRRSDETPGP